LFLLDCTPSATLTLPEISGNPTKNSPGGPGFQAGPDEGRCWASSLRMQRLKHGDV
jgi:hypothetical protein